MQFDETKTFCYIKNVVFFHLNFLMKTTKNKFLDKKNRIEKFSEIGSSFITFTLVLINWQIRTKNIHFVEFTKKPISVHNFREFHLAILNWNRVIWILVLLEPLGTLWNSYCLNTSPTYIFQFQIENISDEKRINSERMTIDAFVQTSTALCLYKYTNQLNGLTNWY